MRPQSRFLAAPLLGITGSGKARPCRPGRGDLLRMTGRRCRSFDRWSPCVAFSHHQVPASHGPLEAAERRYSGPRKGQGFQPRPRVSTFGFTAGPQLTAALSQGRGYGEAGDEGLFCSAKPADPSPTASRSPLSASGRGLLSTDISPSGEMYKLQSGLSALPERVASATYNNLESGTLNAVHPAVAFVASRYCTAPRLPASSICAASMWPNICIKRATKPVHPV